MSAHRNAELDVQEADAAGFERGVQHNRDLMLMWLMEHGDMAEFAVVERAFRAEWLGEAGEGESE